MSESKSLQSYKGSQLHRDHARSHFWRVLLGIVGLIYILICFVGINSDYHLGSSWMTAQAALVSILITCFIVAGRMERRSFYLFSSAYLITFSLFHVSHTFLHAFGIFNFIEFSEGENRRMFEVGGWYILMAMACFCIGAALGWRHKAHRLATPARINLTLADTYWAGIGLLVASILLFGFTWLQVGNIFKYSRAELFKGVGDTRGFGVFLMVFPSAVVLLVIGARSAAQRITSISIAALGILFIMFLGYRSNALFPILAGAIVWVKIGRKVPVALVVGGTFVILLIIPTVGYLRALGSYDKLTTADVASSFAAAKTTDTFLELGAISGIVAYVREWVPNEEPYRYGRTYLRALSEVVPNFGSDIGKNDRHILKSNSYSVELGMTMSPSDWYIYRVNRWMFDTGGGSGFSAVAEAYLNFGDFGVVSIFLLYGFIFGRLDQSYLLNDGWRLIFTCILIWPFLITIRNDFDNFVKPASFALITFFIWKYSTPLIAQIWRRKLLRRLKADAQLSS